MAALIFYLVKVCLCLFVFYLPYVLVMSKTTFFTINRIYLLGCILFSFTLPFIEIETPTSTNSLTETFVEPIQLTEATLKTTGTASSQSGLNYQHLILVIYFLGVTVCSGRLFISIRSMIMLVVRGKISYLGGHKIVQTTNNEVFTFFNIIFLPVGISHWQIINHEKIHVKQFHWIDLLIVEVASVILWFNPLQIFIRRSVKLQHEYLADQYSVITNQDLKDYLGYMVAQYTPIQNQRFVSPFNFPFIKKRINKLTQKRTSIAMTGIYLILIPIISCVLVAFSSRQVYPMMNSEEYDSTLQNDLHFITPLENKNPIVSSDFGDRMHPLFKKKIFHTGVDFISSEGEKVIAPEAGVVVKSVFVEGRGNYIIIKHDDTFSTSYSHLKERMVKEGDDVRKAQVIGLVGNTGLSVNSHLHYEVLMNGDPVDPLPYLSKN